MYVIIQNTLVDKEDRNKKALLRGRLFDMTFHFLWERGEGACCVTSGSVVTFPQMPGGLLQMRTAWSRLLYFAFRNPKKRNIWHRMKTLKVSCSSLMMMDENVYNSLSSFLLLFFFIFFYWAWSLLCLSPFSLTNEIVPLFLSQP